MGWAEAKTDNVPLLAAGMADYAFLAIFPATAIKHLEGTAPYRPVTLRRGDDARD